MLAFLDAGVPPNLPSSRRWTALDEAVSQHDKELVKLLHARETAVLKAEIKAKKADLLKSIAEIPDLSFQVRLPPGPTLHPLMPLQDSHLLSFCFYLRHCRTSETKYHEDCPI